MESMQQIAAVVVVLGLFAAMLYWLRGKGLARFSVKGLGRGATRRMQSLERLPLTAQHSLHLVKIGERVLLVTVSPGGCSVVDGSGWNVPADDQEAYR
jgi:flagellar biogenesis protein FliO